MQRLLSAVQTTAAIFLLLIALLTAGNVLLRDLFAVQIPDWYDGSKLLMGIALFWGIALASYHGSHICVDLLWEHLGPRGKRWLDLVAGSITVAFLAPMAWMVWAKVLTSGTQATTDLRLPLVWFTGVAAAGGVAAVALALLRLFLDYRGHAILQDHVDEVRASDGP